MTYGTLDAAARALHITPSAVSQRIRALEASLGRVLLVRSKPVAVTESGAAALRVARQLDALAGALALDLAGEEGSRRLIPLGVNADSLATWVLPALAGLDGLDFEFHREDQDYTVSYLRDGTVIWEQEFLSGEAHMSHSIANLEHFHFRYPMHRRAGDLHANFFGAAVMSYASGIKTASGDEYEIQAQTFGKPLRNRMVSVPDEGLVAVTQL